MWAKIVSWLRVIVSWLGIVPATVELGKEALPTLSR
jgi:hypothetical protein